MRILLLLLAACWALSDVAWAQDRPIITLKAAEISVYRCVDEKARQIVKHQIPNMTKKEALDACIAEYLKDVKEHVDVRERLIEGITREVDPYAGYFPPERQH